MNRNEFIIGKKKYDIEKVVDVIAFYRHTTLSVRTVSKITGISVYKVTDILEKEEQFPKEWREMASQKMRDIVNQMKLPKIL